MAINGGALDPLFDSLVAGDDPFFQIHTQQDDIFIGLELYTVSVQHGQANSAPSPPTAPPTASAYT